MSVARTALCIVGAFTVIRGALRFAVRSYEQRLQLTQLQDEIEEILIEMRDAREAKGDGG